MLQEHNSNFFVAENHVLIPDTYLHQWFQTLETPTKEGSVFMLKAWIAFVGHLDKTAVISFWFLDR